MGEGDDPNLGRSAARGALTTMAGQALRVVIQVGGIVVLAKLLNPSDYGLLVMVTAVVGVAEVFRDFGLSSASIQAKTLSSKQRDNLFWANTGIGAALTGIVFASSWLIAMLYGRPELVGIAQALSFTFLLNGLATQFKASLNRSMRFALLAVVEVVAPFAGLTAGIVLALNGAGYWALVWQQLSIAGVSLIAYGLMAGWFPGPIHRSTSLRPFLGYGLNLLGVQMLTYASRNVDSIVVGARFGPSPLGLYDRAFQLIALPLNQINAPSLRVALPVLSKLQDAPARFDSYVLRGQTFMVHGVVAAFGLAAAQAPSIVTLVLGDQWIGSVPIFQVLALGGVAQVLGYATYWIFLAKGKTASNLRYSLLTRPIMVAAIIAGSAWGPVGVAAGYSISLLIFWPIGLWWVRRAANAPSALMFRNGLRALLGYGIAALASFFATVMVDRNSLLAFAIGLGAYVATVALWCLLVPSFRRDVVSIAEVARKLRRKN